jgi:hypothetical protein
VPKSHRSVKLLIPWLVWLTLKVEAIFFQIFLMNKCLVVIVNGESAVTVSDILKNLPLLNIQVRNRIAVRLWLHQLHAAPAPQHRLWVERLRGGGGSYRHTGMHTLALQIKHNALNVYPQYIPLPYRVNVFSCVCSR